MTKGGLCSFSDGFADKPVKNGNKRSKKEGLDENIIHNWQHENTCLPLVKRQKFNWLCFLFSNVD